jgi:hypothetical protein
VLSLGKLRTLDVLPQVGDRFVAIADPALSPDEKEIAFVGVAAEGQQDIYVAPVDRSSRARRLTNDFFAKKDLGWGPGGIVYASDATEHGKLNLFRIDPTTGERTRLTTAPSVDRYPSPQPDGSVLYTSDAGGKTDLWELRDGRVRRLTDFTTGLHAPRTTAGGQAVLASTFHGGRFRLVQVNRIALLDEPWHTVEPPIGEPLPIPEREFPAESHPYQGLSARNWRPDAAFVYGGGSSAGIVGRAAALFSDTLRDRVLYVDVSVLGSFTYTQAVALFEDRSRRTGVVLGAYHYVQQQIDSLDLSLAYNQRDFGVTGALRYPLDRYRRFDVELSVGAIQRYCLTDFTGQLVLDCAGIVSPGSPYSSTEDWKRRNGGTNLSITQTLRWDFDSVRYHPTAGPIDGSSLLLELGGGWLPGRSAVHGFSRLDAEHYIQLIGRLRTWGRLAIGTSFSPGGESRLWERSWWLTAADNLRGYGPGDEAFLIGRNYYVINAELRIPLDPILRLLLFQYFTGIVGVDFGGVFNDWNTHNSGTGNVIETGAWASRTLTGVLGFNLAFGPLLFRVHFGHPFDIGGVKTPALLSHTEWVTNITLRYLFF